MGDPITSLGTLVTGLWAARKVLGPTLDKVGNDLAGIYAAGAERILNAAARKCPDLEDGKSANLRVMHEALHHGSFSEDVVAAEYFGGALASSRSEGGEDDRLIHHVDTIRGLSSQQLRLHYAIYRNANLSVSQTTGHLDVGVRRSVRKVGLYFPQHALTEGPEEGGLDVDAFVLQGKGLLEGFRFDSEQLKNGSYLPWGLFHLSIPGIQLFAVAHNRLPDWRRFGEQDFGAFAGLPAELPCARSLDDLCSLLGLDRASA